MWKRPRSGAAHERADAHAARGFAEDRDVAGIAAEGRDVVANPAQGGDLVEEPGVLDGEIALVSEIHPAERAEAVVDGDHDDVAPLREGARIVDRLRARSDHETAAVDPEHDGLSGLRARTRGRVDIEVEAVLALRTDVHARERREGELRLRGDSTEPRRVADAEPRLHGLGRAKTPLADGRLREGNAAKHADSLGFEARELPESCLHDYLCVRHRFLQGERNLA